MEELLQNSVIFIELIQKARNPVLDFLIKFITFTGNMEFFLIVFPFIYWCVDPKKGYQFSVFMIFNGIVNTSLKELFKIPRPFNIDGNEHLKLIEAEGYGMPSGHAQMSICFWGYIKMLKNNKITLSCFIIMPLLVGISRIYLGVHSPFDVLAGWVLGISCFIAFLISINYLDQIVQSFSLLIKIVIIIIVSVLLSFLVSKHIFIVAYFAGLSFGYLFLQEYFNFIPHEKWLIKTITFLMGLLGVFALYIGLKLLLPKENESFHLLFKFVRYLFLSLWIGFILPVILIKFKMTKGN